MPTFAFPNDGALAERLGTGLQNLLQRFDSARHLKEMPLELLQGHLSYKIDTETAGVACGLVDVAGRRDAATLGLWRH